jgi:hypothetical protein
VCDARDCACHLSRRCSTSINLTHTHIKQQQNKTTNNSHKQEAALFEEMRQVAAAVAPDLTVFVMDGSIGQAAFDQAKAFRESVDVGAVILTKLDGHAKGGGALSAVAATKSPVIFYGTGEHIDQFETFESRRFVSRLLGRGDVSGLVDKIQDVIPEDKQPEMLETIARGNVTMRVMRDVFESFLSMGPVSQVRSGLVVCLEEGEGVFLEVCGVIDCVLLSHVACATHMPCKKTHHHATPPQEPMKPPNVRT